MSVYIKTIRFRKLSYSLSYLQVTTSYSFKQQQKKSKKINNKKVALSQRNDETVRITFKNFVLAFIT